MRGRIDLSPGGALAGALLLVLLRWSELAALAAPILAHELGHVGMLLALGQRIRSFRAELGGFRLCYEGGAGPLVRLLIAAAGPAAGFFYALAAARLAERTGLGEAAFSAGLSLALSLMNLLPIRGLDGGEILACVLELLPEPGRGERLRRAVSGCALLLLLGAGLRLLLAGKGAALLAAGLWLLYASLEDKDAGMGRMGP